MSNTDRPTVTDFSPSKGYLRSRVKELEAEVAKAQSRDIVLHRWLRAKQLRINELEDDVEVNWAQGFKAGRNAAADFMESQVDSEWSVFYVANKLRKIEPPPEEQTNE